MILVLPFKISSTLHPKCVSTNTYNLGEQHKVVYLPPQAQQMGGETLVNFTDLKLKSDNIKWWEGGGVRNAVVKWLLYIFHLRP